MLLSSVVPRWNSVKPHFIQQIPPAPARNEPLLHVTDLVCARTSGCDRVVIDGAIHTMKAMHVI